MGEKNAGGAHAGVFRRIDNHFGMGIPEAKPICHGRGREFESRRPRHSFLASGTKAARPGRIPIQGGSIDY